MNVNPLTRIVRFLCGVPVCARRASDVSVGVGAWQSLGIGKKGFLYTLDSTNLVLTTSSCSFWLLSLYLFADRTPLP